MYRLRREGTSGKSAPGGNTAGNHHSVSASASSSFLSFSRLAVSALFLLAIVGRSTPKMDYYSYQQLDAHNTPDCTVVSTATAANITPAPRAPLPAPTAIVNATLNDWPGQPISRPLDSSEQGANPLVRYGQGRGGPIDEVRSYVLDHLDEFLEVYKNRPDKSNSCGIRISHSLAVYTIAKRLQPTTIIESGVNSGQSTYFFRQACPTAKIISLDPLNKPICGQPVRWIDTTNNEYLTEEQFIDFDKVDWASRIRSGSIDPTSTLVFLDDHQGFRTRLATIQKFGFRHIINEDNYKLGEGATRLDKIGLAPKQMWRKPTDPETIWLYHSSKYYAEFPPIFSPAMSTLSDAPKKPQGGFLHKSDDMRHIEEPILRPDIDATHQELFEKIARTLGFDPTMKESQSYQEFMGYCFLCYLEMVPLPPSIREAWNLKY